MNQSAASLRRRRRAHRGFVLITVMVIISLMCVLLLRVHEQALQAAASVNTSLAQSQARNCALSGLDSARAALLDDPELLIDTQSRYTRLLDQPLELAGGVCTLTIEDESGKVNINHLKEDGGQPDRQRIGLMLRLIDQINRTRTTGSSPISYGIVPCLIDWTDADNVVTVLDFVQRDNRGWEMDPANPAICAANRPLATLDELLRVAGVTPASFGGQTRPVGSLNNQPGLSSLLTIQGDGKINLNAAGQWVLMALSDKIGAPQAQQLILRRRQQLFSSLDEFRQLAGLTTAEWPRLAQQLTISPRVRYYRIISSGQYEQSQLDIEAIVQIDASTRTTRIVSYKES